VAFSGPPLPASPGAGCLEESDQVYSSELGLPHTSGSDDQV